jgi:hypothetical protein
MLVLFDVKMMLQYKIGKIMRARGDCQGSPPRPRDFRTVPRSRRAARGVSILGCVFDVFANPAPRRTGAGGASGANIEVPGVASELP